MEVVRSNIQDHIEGNLCCWFHYSEKEFAAEILQLAFVQQPVQGVTAEEPLESAKTATLSLIVRGHLKRDNFHTFLKSLSPHRLTLAQFSQEETSEFAALLVITGPMRTAGWGWASFMHQVFSLDDNSGRSTEDWIFRMHTTLLLQKASFHWQTKLEKQKLSRVSTLMRTNHNHKHFCVTAFIKGFWQKLVWYDPPRPLL